MTARSRAASLFVAAALSAFALAGCAGGGPGASADSTPQRIANPAPRNDLMLLIRLQMESGGQLP